MSRRITLFLSMAITLFANVGCCQWANRWCHNNNSAPQPVQYCAPVAPACAPPPQSYCPPPQQGFQRCP
ncbi:MAG: hypothetical protein WCL32_10520 [Planctomycetota bacterium]